mmetsp:Transcript_33786/g.85129  ORF Transcript_33786/g.85129 Transcript_33786/m.85129 type:complete len:309 (+) Transcript_33786:962-1888(+)
MAPRARLSSLSSSRTGRMPAAVASRRRSLPLKPSAPLATASSDTSSPSRSPLRMARRISTRAPVSGRSQKTRRLKRRSTASSRSCGLLVAARTITREALPAEAMPSHCDMNSFFSSRVASCSDMPLRRLSSASTSSTNMQHGDSLCARLKAARTKRLASPIHLDTSALGESTRNEAPHSAATARASIVLPVPGGPNSSTPRHGALSRRLRKKRSGCSSGSCTASRSASFAFSSAPTSLKPEPASSGKSTSGRRARSYWLSALTCLRREPPSLSMPSPYSMAALRMASGGGSASPAGWAAELRASSGGA